MRVRHKFNAKPVKDDGFHFASKLEYRYKQKLDLMKKAGEVIFYLSQVPFRLPGGVKYVVDYQVFYADGTVDFVDLKGVMTAMSKLKIKQVEELYPIKITIVTKVGV